MSLPDSLPLALAIQRTAACLRALEEDARHFDEVLGQAVGPGLTENGECRAALQGVDHLVQSLEAVAGYLDRMAAELPADVAVDAARLAAPIGLRALAVALSTPLPAHAPPRARADGEVHLF